jgi:hypothetical protein
MGIWMPDAVLAAFLFMDAENSLVGVIAFAG